MTNINEFNITEEELKEIEEITELAQGCTDYFLDSLINPETKEKVELTEEEKNMLSQWNLLTPAQRTAVINIIGLLLSCD